MLSMSNGAAVFVMVKENGGWVKIKEKVRDSYLNSLIESIM